MLVSAGTVCIRATPSGAAAGVDHLVREILLRDAHPRLHPLIRGASSGLSAFKDVLEQLRRPRFRESLPGGIAAGAEAVAEVTAEDLVALGEKALDLEGLEDVVHSQWHKLEDRQAVYLKLLRCNIEGPQDLARSLQENTPGECGLNALFHESGFKTLSPQTIDSLVCELHVRLRQRIHLAEGRTCPVLFTAPHNMYLLRDDHPAHVMEEFTTLIAQRLARQLGGTCISWSRDEQRRSELLWLLARHAKPRTGDDQGFFLNPQNRDPNYLLVDELLHNNWFRQMTRVGDKFRDRFGPHRPTLHVDLHGCRDPPATQSHLTVGVAAMRQEADRARSNVTFERVEAFGAALSAELGPMLSAFGLKPAAPPLRVVGHTSQACCTVDGKGAPAPERFTGARPLAERRVTQSQQAVFFAGFTHSCQLEMSKALRRLLSRDEAALSRFGRALCKAWVAASEPSLPRVLSAPAKRCGSRAKGRARSTSSIQIASGTI